ncbi:MAG TPA: alpha/beta fold hydrolase [Vicinamibacterales bacterium]|jgi:dienelactone hydrolase|nr:alpha/beta fold hydrolase [Vicinamibacterales bacterium]
MRQAILHVVLPIGAAVCGSFQANTGAPQPPANVIVKSGELALHALLWQPSGSGPFPAVLFNHGSYASTDAMPPGDPATVGQVFARHGYVFLFLFRQGIGLSSREGTADGDLMTRALAVDGQRGRNRIQLQLLEGEEMNEALAGLTFLRALPDVDPRRIAVVGHSFGGSLSLLLAAREPDVRAVVIFGGAAGSWGASPQLRSRLRAAVDRMRSAALFIHTANDYSTEPGRALAAEMQRRKLPHQLKIYPAFGAAGDGHNLVFRSLPTWEADVFAFLAANLR